ncbi:helix-turn-helix transcriptional regulator [Moraxella sp. ZJ142]|uniref:helix-turn-helix transcriptional regulator n=1 Tax=Moraxella marmotae TaxID=3344520 RepID=UPI0035D4A261
MKSDNMQINLPNIGYSSLATLAKMLDINRTTLRRWYNSGKFPEPIYLNGKPRFDNQAVLKWAENHAMDCQNHKAQTKNKLLSK